MLLLVMAVPLFLFTTNLRTIINSGWLYATLFDRYQVSLYTDITKPDLLEAARQIKRYFNSDQEPLHVRVPVRGVETDLYTDLEVAHMQDVKGLVQGLAFWQAVTFIYIAAFAAVGFFLWGRRQALRRLAKGLFLGSLLTLGILLLLGALSFLGFDELFVRFHELSFSNDFWMLPDNAMLLQMFPEGFFLDATLIVAGLTIGEALLTAAVTGLWLRYDTRRIRI